MTFLGRGRPLLGYAARAMTKRAQASERVRAEWLRRVEAEYRSAAVTQHLTLWLIQIGASPDLLAAGLRIVRDELAHAAMSHRAFLAAGGAGGPAMARETLGLPRTAGALEDDVTRVCLDVFCLGETVAVRLFKELRQACDVPSARRVLDRVLRDEVRHRDFGWALLGWLLEYAWAWRAPCVAASPRALPGVRRAASAGCTRRAARPRTGPSRARSRAGVSWRPPGTASCSA